MGDVIAFLEPLTELGRKIDIEVAALDSSLSATEEQIHRTGRMLWEAKQQVKKTKGLTWPVFLDRHCTIGIKERRANDLIAMALGRVSPQKLLEQHAAAQRRYRTKQKSASRDAEIEQILSAIEGWDPDKQHELKERLGLIAPHPFKGAGSVEWYTPPWLLALCRKALGTGQFDLDPASCEIAQANVQARNYYSLDRKQDGLALPWSGKVFLNPPYRQPAMRMFAERLVEQVANGNVEAAIMLCNSYTDTKWFHATVKAATSVCFLQGRVQFVLPDTTTAQLADGQLVFYFGSQPALFESAFAESGFVVRGGGRLTAPKFAIAA